MDSTPQIRVLETAWQWWTYAANYEGYFAATRRLLGVLWEFVRDSTPERLRARFGDADYDWDYRVNTTSGAVGWRDRLLGMFHSAYQPTEPAAFHEMIRALQQTRRSRPHNSQRQARLPRLHFYRSRFRQGTHAADGVGLSLPPDYRRGTSAVAARNRATELAPVQERIAEMFHPRNRSAPTPRTSPFLRIRW